MKHLFIALCLALIPGVACAGNLTLDGDVTQGGLIRAQAEPGAKAMLDGHAIRVAPDGGFIFGFGRDATAHARLDVTFRDGSTVHRDLAITPRQYDIRRIDNLPKSQVTPAPETMARIKREAAEINAALGAQSDGLAFERPLIWPVTGIITGIYGSQTVMNGQPRAPHFGVDVAAPSGTPIKAANAGIVTLAEPDLYFTGGTVIIDHGYGLSTTYVHLQNMAVKLGDRVTQGQFIGEMGMTGRATGPNLHWAVNWNGVRLDPMLAAGPMPKDAASAKP